MARKVQVVLEDDIDGGIADETITFALDGAAYEIDLSEANADRLRSALKPYVEAGRRSGGRSRRTGAAGAGKGDAAKVRAWAQANGIEVSARGRVSAEVMAKYEAAHS
ncbi:MAG: Lsr2 family protein [Candidatus Nanopelagicales bacterium]